MPASSVRAYSGGDSRSEPADDVRVSKRLLRWIDCEWNEDGGFVQVLEMEMRGSDAYDDVRLAVKNHGLAEDGVVGGENEFARANG